MNQIKIGNFFKSLRKAKNITQQKAADSLYVSQKNNIQMGKWNFVAIRNY